MDRLRQYKTEDVLGVLLAAFVLTFAVYRLFFSVELSDEAYSVAENYLVARGGLPFVNNWSQMPGYTLLLAPFTYIYVNILDGTEGIVLFTRFVCLGLTTITALSIFGLLKKHCGNKSSCLLCVLLYVAINSCGVQSFRGDNIAVLLFGVGTVLLVLSHFKENRCRSYALVSGILLALGVLSYPTIVIQYLWVVVANIIIDLSKKEKTTLPFLVGSAVATIVVTGYLIGSSGFGELMHGIQCLLKDVTYFQMENEGVSKLPAYIGSMCWSIALLAVFSLGGFGLVILINATYLRKINRSVLRKEAKSILVKKGDLKKQLLISLCCGICMDICFQVYRFRNLDSGDILVHVTTILFFAVPFLWGFVEKNKLLSKRLMFFVWMPSFAWVVITGISTYSDMFKRNWMLENAAFLAILFLVWAVEDLFSSVGSQGKKTGSQVVSNRSIAKIMPVIVIGVVAAAYIFNAFSYIYRDDSFRNLTTRVESGVYKGLYTTAARASGVMALENVVRSYTTSKDRLLAMDNDPFVYLMTDAVPCTPSTWDQALYTYGFNRPELYYDYFNVTDSRPTKIIYMNYGRDPIMSIDTDGYKFNQFVKGNYSLIYENRGIFQWNYEGNLITCELLIYNQNE